MNPVHRLFIITFFVAPHGEFPSRHEHHWSRIFDDDLLRSCLWSIVRMLRGFPLMRECMYKRDYLPDLLFRKKCFPGHHWRFGNPFRHSPIPVAVGEPAGIFLVSKSPSTGYRLSILTMTRVTGNKWMGITKINIFPLRNDLRIRPPASGHVFVCVGGRNWIQRHDLLRLG